jgi:hypothetical protein
MSARFPDRVVATIHESRLLRIRAGTGPHRPIGIWAVVVEGRVFVRSWSVTPRGWYRTLRGEPIGVIQVEGREIPVRAVFTRGEHLKDLVSRAYLEKYDTPGAIPYARDLGRSSSRKTTTELTPCVPPPDPIAPASRPRSTGERNPRVEKPAAGPRRRAVRPRGR